MPDVLHVRRPYSTPKLSRLVVALSLIAAGTFGSLAQAARADGLSQVQQLANEGHLAQA